MAATNYQAEYIMYQFKFAVICRTDRKNNNHHFSTIADADSEYAAHRKLFGKFFLFLQSSLPVLGGEA